MGTSAQAPSRRLRRIHPHSPHQRGFRTKPNSQCPWSIDRNPAPAQLRTIPTQRGRPRVEPVFKPREQFENRRSSPYAKKLQLHTTTWLADGGSTTISINAGKGADPTKWRSGAIQTHLHSRAKAPCRWHAASVPKAPPLCRYRWFGIGCLSRAVPPSPPPSRHRLRNIVWVDCLIFPKI